MWHISKQVKEQFTKCNLLPIHESDDEWQVVLREVKEDGEDLIATLKEELKEVKDELLQVLPSRFIPYVENGTLNQPTLPKSVREDYLQWISDADKRFEQILDASNQHTKQAVSYLSPAVQDIFEESLHDAIIERIERVDDTLHLYVNTDGGFSSKALIHFIFKGVTSEITDEPLQIGQWFIYDELQKIDDEFGFRVLFECPECQWTITMKELDAEYFYRPKEFTILRDEEKLEDLPLIDYIASLNEESQYWFITPDGICAIQSLSEEIILENGKIEFGPAEIIVTIGNKCFIYNLAEFNPINFIYTNIFEDPYAHMNEPVPFGSVEEAAMSDNLELQVRAWNTMYTHPNELTDIINRVFLKIEITEENEMMVTVYFNHFYEIGILTDTVIDKYQKLMD